MKSLDLNLETIKAQFENETHQHIVLLKLYKLLHPEFDRIQKFNDWPKCNKFTWKYICMLFQEFDHKYHPDVIAGGCWMNSGFSIDNNLINWEFLPAQDLRYFGNKNPIERIYINYSWIDTSKHRQVRISIKRKFNSNNYTIKHFAKFAKLLHSMGFKIEFNKVPNFTYFERI